MFWSLKKVLIASSVLATGGGGGWAIYDALKKDVETIRKARVKDNAFWDAKIKVLEKKLVALNERGDHHYNELVEKIAPNGQKVVFALDSNKSKKSFYSDHETQQRQILEQFCEDKARRDNVDRVITVELCD
ncbi:hypothetical protein A6V39_05440 [Candidatus Mycoplasma haematobovis]|uniref:Uncharacterized protein n=1 Tax=Candidatus Mycoplasma haematobovis TaxID=432608 RepID=A0A1A9QBA8_9MOLU|nr:hypothetical protein [Candidatus Mycoplasma haematobovis]OAL09737.1 hypothetical protein A6V39_05440 [Candidatus Mycoplasma haematobovis]